MRAGEIVGIAGVDGNGQTRARRGPHRPAQARVGGPGRGWRDTELTKGSARERLEAGLGHIPEDRLRRGIILDFSLAENLALHDYRHEPNSHRGWLDPSRMVASARELISEFDVRGGGAAAKASELSGGNQQKLVVAREISRDPSVLIAAQPTRGLDVGAIEFLHRRLVAERDEGARDPARLARARGDPVALRPDPRHVRGRRSSASSAPGVDAETLGIAMIGGGGNGEAVAA